MKSDPRIEIGGIARAHGIKGEVAIVTHDPDSSILARCRTIWVSGSERKILEARHTTKGWLVVLDGVTTRTEAELLRGQPVEVDRELLQLAEGDILLHDLVGCKVQLVDGTPWGEIAAVDPGAGPAPQDLLVIHDGEIEKLVPLVDQFVKRIDIDNNLVVLDPPIGIPTHRR